MARDTTQLQAILAPTIEALGYEFVGCLYIPQGRHAVLRIYVDRPDGITVDDCERVSRQVSAVLDVEDPIQGTYTLEVSSPGLDRPLFTREHFVRFTGKKAHIRLHVPQDSRRHFTGIIQNVVDDNIIIQTEDEKFTLALTNIARANLEIEVSFKKK